MVSRKIFFKNTLFCWLFRLCSWLYGEFFCSSKVVNIIMCFTCKFIFLFNFNILFNEILVGMLVVSLNTLPYHMLSQFHADETVNN